MIQLVDPDIRFHRTYLEATDEFGDTPRDGNGLWREDADGDYPGYEFTRDELQTPAGFARFVAFRREAALPEAVHKPGWVACTFFWVAEGERYLGSLALRHELNAYLLREGGHIGYSVRPSARRRGVASEALRLALPEARALGIDPVLVTCEEGNEGSRRAIEANGGVYEDSRVGVRRYWVPTH